MESETAVLREAYNALDYELVEVSEQLSVPSASPAFFDYETPPTITNAEEIVERLNRSEWACIDMFPQNGDSWYEFSVSGTAYYEDTNEFCKFSISTSGVSVFVKNEHGLSYEAFVDFVDLVETLLKCNLRYSPKDD